MEEEVTAGGICAAVLLSSCSQFPKIVARTLSQMYRSSLEEVFRAKRKTGLNIFRMDFHENVFMHNIHKPQKKNSPDFL